MAFSTVDTVYKLQYQRNVELAVQQKVPKLERAFTYHPDVKGRQAALLELVGPVTANTTYVRGGDTPNIRPQHDSVWVVPEVVEWGVTIEKEDAIKALTDYQSPYVQAGALAVMRGKEEKFAAAIFGSRKVGLDGTTTEAYDNTGRLVAEDVGVTPAAATGMNVKKILRAFRLLEQFEIDIESEEIFCALNAVEIEQLYNDITYVNQDYRSRAVLEEKRVLSILGVQIISTQRLPNLDANTHRAALWLKSGMHWAEFSAVETSVEPNPAKKYRLHPYIETWVGATRGENQKVIEILNNFV